MKSDDSIIVAVNEDNNTQNKIELYNDAVGLMLGVTIQKTSGEQVSNAYQISPITVDTPIFKLKCEKDIFAVDSNTSDPKIELD